MSYRSQLFRQSLSSAVARRNELIAGWVFTILLTGIFAAFLAHVSANSVNLPTGDDYEAILDFIERWRSGESERLSLLFERHNEHWIVVPRLTALTVLAVNGEISFRVMKIFAVAGLLLIAGLISYRPKIAQPLGIAAFLILALWMLRPQSFKMIFSAMASVQALWGLAFAAAYLFFVVRRGSTSAAIAAILFPLALLGNSNAVLLAPIAVIFLWLRGRAQAALVQVLIALPFLALFLSTLGKSPASSGALTFISDHPWTFLTFFVGLLGGSLVTSVFGNSEIALVFGIFVGATASWYLYAVKDTSDDFAKPLIVYCILSCALIALGRSKLYAAVILDMLADGRYVIYSLACVGVLLHRAVIRWRPHIPLAPQRMIVLAVALALAVSAYAYEAPRVAQWREAQVAHFKKWAKNMRREFNARRPHQKEALVRAICDGTFKRNLMRRCRDTEARK